MILIKKIFFLILLIATHCNYSNEYIVLLPDEIANILNRMQPRCQFENASFISLPAAYAYIQQALKWIDADDRLIQEDKDQFKKYLFEYEKYLENPLVWQEKESEDQANINRRKEPNESSVLFDMWVQHALRARILTIDSYLEIRGNLSVSGNVIDNNTVVAEGSANLNGALNVAGPANFNKVFIGGPTGCSGGLLVLCGLLVLNGIGITGPFGPTGPTGSQGPQGNIGPRGPTGPPGMINPTGGMLTITSTAASTGCASGALTVAGGVGIGGDLNVCGTINTFTDYRITSQPVLNANQPNANLSLGFFTGNVNNGTQNVLVGKNAGLFLTSGVGNTVIGPYSLPSQLTSGTFNTLFGQNSGQVLSSGITNSFFGFESGQATLGTSSGNTFIGAQAGLNATGSMAGFPSVIVGAFAANATSLSNTPLVGGVFIGNFAGEFAAGNNNVIEGFAAGSNTLGNDNTFIGYQAGQTNTGSGSSSGSGNIAFGADAGFSQGTFVNAAAIGANATATQSNIIQLGSTGVNVQVAIPGSTGPGVLLPNPGGNTGEILNYYDTFVAPVSFNATDGTNITPTVFGTITYTRIGRQVIAIFSGVSIPVPVDLGPIAINLAGGTPTATPAQFLVGGKLPLTAVEPFGPNEVTTNTVTVVNNQPVPTFIILPPQTNILIPRPEAGGHFPSTPAGVDIVVKSCCWKYVVSTAP